SPDRWQLPDGVDELLPDAAWRVETLRRRIVDRCHSWGYELVMPPMIEYLDSLLTGTGETMDLQTFKLVDQQNGRTLGVRADMTPQVARMDAHALRGDHPNRLFYTGSVLRARPDGFGGSRSPLQFGAEIFGHSGAHSDIEIVRLMLATLSEAQLPASALILDLGHVGVYRALVAELELDKKTDAVLFSSVQRGSFPDVQAMLEQVPTAQQNNTAQLLGRLMHLRGSTTVLDEARSVFANAANGVQDALASLQAVIDGVKTTHPEIQINVDLAELRGYSYHTGVLFAAYTQSGQELARGGRYDAVGAAFGHPRPATGFSGDLKMLADTLRENAQVNQGIFVCAELVDVAWPEIVRLRNSGERVMTELPGIDQQQQALQCDRVLVQLDNSWSVQARS
ncbi:UNVERIFIED_CONTAM: hypothetical protein GTU68_037168, partial [Idotea baltica]|nr:hypothetical protein [Idotea baltica]